MYVVCPNCQTSYILDGAQIGADGKAMRCSNCGTAWRQFPPPVEPEIPEVEAELESTENLGQAGIGTPGTSQPFSPGGQSGEAVAYPPPYPYPPPYFMPPQAVDGDPQNLTPQPYPYPYPYPYPPVPPVDNGEGAVVPQPVEASPKPQEELVAESSTPTEENVPREEEGDAGAEGNQNEDEIIPSDEELTQALGDDTDLGAIDSATPQTNEEIEPISEEALEALEDPDPIPGMDAGGVTQMEEPGTEPEDLPDPEPMPAGSSEETTEKKSSLKTIIFIVLFIVIIGSVIGGLVVARHSVIGFWPGANDALYGWMGLRVPQPGDGLEISLKSPQRKKEGGKDVIVFDVIIRNVSENAQKVPNVILILTDAEGQKVQEIISTPPELNVDPEKFIRFTAKFPNAPASARRSDAKWGDYPQSEKQK